MIPVDITDQNQSWTIIPIEKPSSTSEQDWLLVLTGVGTLTLPGNKANDWRHETLLILPDMQKPMRSAIEKYSIHKFGQPQGSIAGTLAFSAHQWAPFAAISSVFDKETRAIDAGFAVDAWRPYPFFDITEGNSASQLFSGIEVDVAVLNKTVLYRVSYHITLVGKIVSEFLVDPKPTGPPIIE